jgi:hypothetical protein
MIGFAVVEAEQIGLGFDLRAVSVGELGVLLRAS